MVFDLDQTLLRGEVADWAIWLASVEEALGVALPADEDWAALPVHTDHGLLDALSWRYRGRAFGAEERAGFEARLYARVDAELAARPRWFTPIDGAGELLAALDGRAALATGNLHAATLRKLTSSGLPRLPCSCSAPGVDRPELVRRALLRVGWTEGAPATSFGDGVWDVRAARALGVGFVGVAASDAHEARLRAAGARRVIRDYQQRDAVLALIEVAEPPGPEAAVAAWHAPREG